MAGKRGGVRHTIAGSVGEYQADKLFAVWGRAKLSPSLAKGQMSNA